MTSILLLMCLGADYSMLPCPAASHENDLTLNEAYSDDVDPHVVTLSFLELYIHTHT